jgi:glycosyltransferase involved in cell wall biosynthesis
MPYRSDTTTAERNHSSKKSLIAHAKAFKTVGRSRSQFRKGITRRSTKSSPEAADYPIIVHCHLCWDWVWQRPQQFLSRLSQKHPVLFIETLGPRPELVAPHVRFEPTPEYPNITRIRVQFPDWRWGQSAYVDRTRRKIIQEVMHGPLAGQFDDAVQWFYDPMTYTAFAGQMGEIATVYDCMDEHSKFSEAHPECAQREAALLARADVVFTGGRKLYEAKKQHNRNCHFYGCGVDVEHFGRARDMETLLPSELKNLGEHVLGYFGVIDERLDYKLLLKLAEANPQWSIVMVGPVLKVKNGELPQRPNLHWLGQRSYADLPAYAKTFDVCLMPFALNEATEYINPTKALEYMATGRVIVSSAVPDVVNNFGSVVKVARSHDEFITLCRQATAKADTAAVRRGLEMAAENTWEIILEKMEAHINEVLARKRRATTKAGGAR